MKKLALIMFACCLHLCGNAQTNASSAPKYSGNFFVTQNTSKGVQKFSVGYSLTPATLTTQLNLYAQAWEETMLGFKIRNSHNDVVIAWKPEKNTRLFIHEFDISNLAAGSYKLEMYGDGNKLVNTVSFQKQNQ